MSRKNKSITISTVANALARIKAREAAGEAITGQKIGCYGASYLYPVFLQLGIIHLPQANDENHCNKLQAHNRLHNLLCAFCMFCTKIGQNE